MKAAGLNGWRYSTKTEESIRTALLTLLASNPLHDITVSELSRQAHVSRSTFYEHFKNPAEVYDEIVREFAAGLSPLLGQIACTHDIQPQGKPFCALLCEESPFGPAVKDDRFLSAFLADRDNLGKHDLYEILTHAGYSEQQAGALCAFQLSGCFAAARTYGGEVSWPTIKAAIDRFILGGISACLAHADNEERQPR